MVCVEKKYKKAFTLIEILVSLTIFAVAIAIAVGAFTVVLRGQRNGLAAQAVQDNASVLMELMAREIRTGDSFAIPGVSAPNPLPQDPSSVYQGSSFSFKNANGQNVVYSVVAERLEREINGTKKVISPGLSKLKVKNFRFVLDGHIPGDGKQPSVTIIGRFENVGIRPEEQVGIDVSTTITQRDLDS